MKNTKAISEYATAAYKAFSKARDLIEQHSKEKEQ